MSGMTIRKSRCNGSLIPVRTLVSSLFSLFIFPFSEVPSRCAAVLFIASLFREAEEGKRSFSVFCDGVSMAPAFWCRHAARNTLTIPLRICVFLKDPAETLGTFLRRSLRNVPPRSRRRLPRVPEETDGVPRAFVGLMCFGGTQATKVTVFFFSC